MLNRRKSRDFVFKLLYETSFHDKSERQTIYTTAFEERGGAENEYIKNVYFGTLENLPQIDKIIMKNAIGWRIERISRVSLAALRLSVYEMIFMQDIPFNISINEALELVKEYDEESARTFVNGVLDAVSKGLLKSDKDGE